MFSKIAQKLKLGGKQSWLGGKTGGNQRWFNTKVGCKPKLREHKMGRGIKLYN